MLQKKNEGILFSAEIRVVGSYTDRLLNTLLLLNECFTCSPEKWIWKSDALFFKSTISLPFTDCFELAQKEMFP